MVKFQSTHLHEVWQLSQSFGNFMLTFQSTHLHEVWRAEVITSVSLRCFNPHTYMRCDARPTTTPTGLFCFNPHTYMRCDFPAADSCPMMLVSIHTPTWGVTEKYQMPVKARKVSIHTPTWGVTPDDGNSQSRTGRFNPHTYMRCDSGIQTDRDMNWVSIHTPTWGVTSVIL